MTAPSITVVVPSVRGGERLVRLIERLGADATDAELLVADNGLDVETARAVGRRGGTIVRMGRNRGFGAAVNRAARRAGGDVLVVLNDDLEVDDRFLSALVAPVAEGATMAAGVLLQKDARRLIETAGIEIDATLGAHDYLRGERVDVLRDGLLPPLAPCGGAAAYRLDAFREARGFDEGFFAYFEDLDLALRLRASGASCALAHRARAVHAWSATLGPTSVAKATLVGFSRGYLLRKYGVLNVPSSGAVAVAQESAASLVLAARHRSLAPARARVRGWRTCGARALPPDGDAVTVGLGEAWRRRYSRASSGRLSRSHR